MLHHAIVLKSKGTIQGNGLFTGEFIPKGTLIWRLDDPTYSLAEIKTWPKEKCADFYHYGFQCGVDRYSLPEGVCREMNHSCDPNTWWQGSDSLIARRDILVDEEITYDYASSEITIDLAMECSCGSLNCRKRITHQDYKDPAWQQLFGTHLPPHVLAAINELNGL